MVVAAVIIGLSVATTLYFSDFLLDAIEGGGSDGYRNITFTDALMKCQQENQSAFKGKLNQVAMDEHSSRFDQYSNQYKIFFKAEVHPTSEDSDGTFYINCFVNARTGRIGAYEGMEQKASPTEAIRRNDGGLFGWPRNTK